MKTSTIIRIVVSGLIGVVAVVSLFVLPVDEYLVQLLDWVRSTGAWGPVFLAAAYMVACVFFVPGWILTLGAGFLFGVVRGTIAVSAGSVLGATAAFLIGRTLLRKPIEKKIAAYPRFQAIDRAVGQQGFKIVLLVRLSPIFPFNLLNYAFGLTKVSLRQYVLASWLGMLPVTVLYVYIGSALKSLADVAAGNTDRGIAQEAFFIAGLVMALVATIVITRIARRALNEAVDPEQQPR
jgi:uncharacterized membrane protein YdjX (TVP38/TMEM64 family)